MKTDINLFNHLLQDIIFSNLWAMGENNPMTVSKSIAVIDRKVDGWMDGWMDGQIDRYLSSRIVT